MKKIIIAILVICLCCIPLADAGIVDDIYNFLTGGTGVPEETITPTLEPTREITEIPTEIPIDEIQPTIITVWEGATPIKDSLSAKSAGEKASVLTSATKDVLKDVRYPYAVEGSELTILKSKCTDEICGYWVSCTRKGEEVYTDSPVWISPPPYEVFVSSSFDEKTFTSTVILKEDPKAAAEEVLKGYCDRQPLGKAVSYER